MKKILFLAILLFVFSFYHSAKAEIPKNEDFVGLTVYGQRGWSYKYSDEYQDLLGAALNVHPWWLENEDETFLLGLGFYAAGNFNQGKIYSETWQSRSLDAGISFKNDWHIQNTNTFNLGVGKLCSKSDYKDQETWYFKANLNFNLEKRRYQNKRWWPKTTLNLSALIPFADEVDPEEREAYDYGRLAFQGDWSIYDAGEGPAVSPGIRLGLISQKEEEEFQYKIGFSLSFLQRKDEIIRFYVDVNPVVEYIYAGFIISFF